jgi:hypothetical protein
MNIYFKIALKITGGAFLLALLAGASCSPTVTTTPTDFNKDYRLVIPHTIAAYDAIDGDNNETRWTNDAFKLGFIDGTDQALAFMMGVADNDNLYLYFELEEVNYSQNDTVAILIAPQPSNPDNNRLLLIRSCPDSNPMTSTGVCYVSPLGNNKLGTVTYYTIDPATHNWNDGEQNPALLTNKIKVQTLMASPGFVRYGVEVELSRAAFNLPATGYFGLYTNILQQSGIAVTQYTWPFSDLSGNANKNLIYNNLTALPPPGVWGNATLDDSNGPGVFIVSSDIYTNHGGGSTLSTDQPNIFTAVARNASNNAAGMAQDVVATFKWANFGLPSRNSFHKIPTNAVAAARGNPPAAQDIPPTGSATYTFDWSVSEETPADQADYTDGSHWCVQVELSSMSGATFYRSSAQRNMDFAETASPFERTATIDARGIRKPENARFHEYILEERFYNFDPELKWESKLENAEKLANGFYRLQVPVEDQLKMDMSVLPPQEALVPYEIIQLNEGPHNIKVIPGYLLTVLPEELRSTSKAIAQKQAVATDAKLATLSTATTKPGIDNSDHYPEPPTHGTEKVNAPTYIRAAWKFDESVDGERLLEKDGFLLGSSFTLKVPKDAKELVLKVNSGNQEKQAIRVYATKLEKYHLYADPSLAYEGKNIRPGLGANLPTAVYIGKRNTNKTLTIDGRKYKVYAPAGSFSYIVKGRKADQ